MSKPQKIVLIANFLPDRQESMQRFAQVLLEGFRERSLQVELWRPEPRFVKWVSEYRYGGFPKYLGYLDKFYVFRRTLRRRVRNENTDTVYHIVDHGNAVYASDFARAPLVVTCHDLLQIRSALGEFPQNRISRSGRSYQQWILKSLARLRLAVCVSQKTREDLRRLTGLSEQATPVIYNGLNYPYRPMPALEAVSLLRDALTRNSSGLTRLKESTSATAAKFFLGIGGAQWYKNRTGLIEIFCEIKRLQPSQQLFYVGPKLDHEQQALLEKHGLSDGFRHLVSLTNEELRAAYSLADGLIFPSWEEGFGWPIAEAQACGCPVFTSNRAPMTEVGGEAAVYFDPATPAAAAQTIVASLSRREEMRANGLSYARRWDRETMVDAYLELYEQLLEKDVVANSLRG